MTPLHGSNIRMRGADPSKLASRAVAFAVIGWVIAYNVLRIGGDNPAQAWKPSLLVGGLAGLLVFALFTLLVWRMAASGRVMSRRPATVGGTFDETQRDALRIATPLLLGAAGIAGVVGLAELVEWWGSSPRAMGTLVFVVWNLVFAMWVGDEGLRVRRSLVDGLETVFVGCLLTAVLAGVALSRSLLEPMQVILALTAGMGGMGAAMAVWRLGGGRGFPVGVAVAFLVTIGSLALPILL